MGPIDRLPAKPPRALLDELEQLAVRVRAGAKHALPDLTVYLSGGQTLAGQFIAFDGAQRALLLHCQGQRASLDVASVALESIAALMLHHSAETLASLSGGKIAPPVIDAPSRLAVERLVASCAEALSQALGSHLELNVDWAALGHNEGARACVAAFLPVLSQTFRHALADELGRRALEGVAQLRVGAGPFTDVKRSGRALEITLRQAADQLFAPSHEEFDRALLAAL